MKIDALVRDLGLTVYTTLPEVEKEVDGAYVSDLLSDVMGNAREGQAWITLQSHANVVAIAALKELPAVILVKGIVPGEELIRKAEVEGVVLLGSRESAFDTAGKLYALLKNR
ncbi:MAG: serine kinase [Bacteroidales bacterium]